MPDCPLHEDHIEGAVCIYADDAGAGDDCTAPAEVNRRQILGLGEYAPEQNTLEQRTQSFIDWNAPSTQSFTFTGNPETMRVLTGGLMTPVSLDEDDEDDQDQPLETNEEARPVEARTATTAGYPGYVYPPVETAQAQLAAMLDEPSGDGPRIHAWITSQPIAAGEEIQVPEQAQLGAMLSDPNQHVQVRLHHEPNTNYYGPRTYLGRAPAQASVFRAELRRLLERHSGDLEAYSADDLLCDFIIDVLEKHEATL